MDDQGSHELLNELSQEAFGLLIEPFRRELQAHCYRMLGSMQDAEDLVQETFLRAWRRRETYQGLATVRAWLYGIATHVCLDVLKKRRRRFVPRTYGTESTLAQPIPASISEPIWLEPYPDEWLRASAPHPETYITSREHIQLAFIAALQLLPARQRAVLILREVLDLPASEVADVLEMTVSAVKSLLFRARRTLTEQGETGLMDAQPQQTISQQRLNRYVNAWETADVEGLIGLLKEDATFSMPPIPSWYRGRETIRGLVTKTIFAGAAHGRWRLLPTQANCQIAFGLYRQSDEPGLYHAYGIQVITWSGAGIADIITFRVPDLLPYFQLPEFLKA